MQIMKKEFDVICSSTAKQLEGLVRCNPGITGFEIMFTVKDLPEGEGNDFLRVVKVAQKGRILI